MADPDNTEPTEEKNSDEYSVNRRSFVKTVGAASGAMGFGALGSESVSATSSSAGTMAGLDSAEKEQVREQLKSVRQPYNTPRAAQNAIRTHRNQLLNGLSNQGIITASSVSSLNTREFTPSAEFSSTREGMGITSFFQQDTPTAHIYVSKQTREYHVTIVVQPQIERSYAIIRQSAEDHKNVRIVEGVNGSSSVSTNDIEATRYAGVYVLSDGSPEDPTGGDNCWSGCETYHFYCTNGGRNCYLGAFKTCENNLGVSCYYRVYCNQC